MTEQARKGRPIDYIKSDCYRFYGVCNTSTMLSLYLKNSTFRWQVGFRLRQGNKYQRILGKIIHRIHKNTKIDIPDGTTIGYGLFIGHGGPILINESVTIGNNCNLSQFTSIGSNYEHAATIGDNVYIGPNVSIVEDVKIGNNVTIGAGSVVTKDIPDNATAVGNYAKVINYKEPGRFVNRRWQID